MVILWRVFFVRLTNKKKAGLKLFSIAEMNIWKKTRTYVVYFDQLSGACSTCWKLVELLFFSRFQTLLLILNLFQWVFSVIFCVFFNILWLKLTVKFVLASKNNFDEQTTCGAPICWSKNTTCFYSGFYPLYLC